MRGVAFRTVSWIVGCMFPLLAWGQQGGRAVCFAVNGQLCQSGVSHVGVGEALSGKPLQLSLSGLVPTGKSLEFYVERDQVGRAKGVLLEYEGQSVGADQGVLRIPLGRVAGLWHGEGALRLHLGEAGAQGTGRLIVHARLPRASEDLARVVIEFVALRAPLGDQSWGKTALMQQQNGAMQMYPNPVKSGMVLHIDLLSMPYGRKGNLSIVNVLGTSVYSVPVQGGDLVECPSEGLSKGVYLVRVELEGTATRTGRLVVDR